MVGRPRKVTVTLPVIGGDSRLVKPVVVDDPYEKGAKLVVVKNIATSTLDMMLFKRRIDEAMYDAGVRVQRLLEREEIGGAKAIDYSRVRVDGGSREDPLSDDLVQARKELTRVASATGIVGYQLLRVIIGEGLTIQRVVRERPSLLMGLRGRNAEGYISGRFSEALRACVSLWGMVGKGYYKKRIQASQEGHTGPVQEWEVGRFQELVLVPPKAAPQRDDNPPPKTLKRNPKGPKKKVLIPLS